MFEATCNKRVAFFSCLLENNIIFKKNKMLKYLLFCFPILMFSQTHRFIYEVNYRRDSTENIKTKAFFHLDINPEETLYYDRTIFESDSIKNLELNTGFPAPNLNEIFVHQKNSKQYDNYEFLGWDFIKRISEPEQNWTLSPEKKTLGNYHLQKASTKWSGRQWIAWFAPDIPFADGPQKFHGLPGLIVELEDDKDNFSFKLVKSQNYPQTQKVGILHTFFSNSLLLNDKKYLKFKTDHYKDPLAYAKNGTVDLAKTEALILEDGTHVTQKNIREVTLSEQKKIKKYNNPIELDKAIYYEGE